MNIYQFLSDCQNGVFPCECVLCTSHNTLKYIKYTDNIHIISDCIANYRQELVDNKISSFERIILFDAYINNICKEYNVNKDDVLQYMLRIEFED